MLTTHHQRIDNTTIIFNVAKWEGCIHRSFWIGNDIKGMKSKKHIIDTHTTKVYLSMANMTKDSEN
jgi:hypothetical protein